MVTYKVIPKGNKDYSYAEFFTAGHFVEHKSLLLETNKHLISNGNSKMNLYVKLKNLNLWLH